MVTGIALLSVQSCASRPKRDIEQSFVQYQLGVEYYRGRRLEAAVEELNKSLKADPENADAYSMLGVISLNQGHDLVMQAETLTCLKGKDSALVHADAHRKFEEADRYFRKAISFRSEFPGAWNNLAVTALQLRDWDTAISASGQALKDSTYSEPEVARTNLGWAYFQKKEIQNAWKELHEAVARAPKFCVGRFRLAKVYVERGEIDDAADQIAVVTEEKENRCPIQEAFLLGGMIEQRRKARDRALALFQRCAEMAPKSCVAEECRQYARLIQ